MSWRRRLLVAAIVSLCATAALAILILLFGDFGETEGRILGTTAAISFFSLLALPGGILVERRAAVTLGAASIALSAAALLLVLFLLWSFDDSETLGKIAGTIAVFAVALTQVSALTSRRRADDTRAVLVTFAAASVLAFVLAVLATAAIWGDIGSSAFYRALAALAVLDVLLVVLQPFLRRLSRDADGATVRVVLEGTSAAIEDALVRIEGTGVRVRR